MQGSKEQAKSIGAKRPTVCNEEGHFARDIRKESSVFEFASSKKANFELLKHCTKDMIVRGKECCMLRDSAAALNVVDPKNVSSSKYLSECAWIREAVNKSSPCLPMALVRKYVVIYSRSVI